MASTRMQIRIDSKLKKGAENILEKQGIKPTQAITMFYTEIERIQGFPFLPSKVPNKELAKSLRDARAGKDVMKHKNIEDLFDFLDKE